MKKVLAVAAMLLLQMSAWAQEPGKPELNRPDPPMLGLHWARGAQPEARTNNAGPGGVGRSPNLTYHGGLLMTTTTVVESIFWGPKWSSSPTWVDDKVAGLNDFYSQVSGTTYAITNIEYKNSSGAPVSSAVSYQGIHSDGTLTPTKAPTTSAVLARVCANISSPVANGYYPVYTDIRRGNAGYCAWHSWGTCNSVNVQFGFFFDLDNDAGCSSGDYTDQRAPTDNLPTAGLASLISVTGHELSEVMTDPRGTGWYDAQGYENSDKCAWDFGGQLIQIGSSKWKIQGNWSNAAYDSTTRGYKNDKGQKGCIDGGAYKYPNRNPMSQEAARTLARPFLLL